MKDKVWDRIINGTTTKEDEETISLERVFLAICFVLVGLSWFGLCIAAFVHTFIGGVSIHVSIWCGGTHSIWDI